MCPSPIGHTLGVVVVILYHWLPIQRKDANPASTAAVTFEILGTWESSLTPVFDVLVYLSINSKKP
jgi:hypothetical protein